MRILENTAKRIEKIKMVHKRIQEMKNLERRSCQRTTGLSLYLILRIIELRCLNRSDITETSKCILSCFGVRME